MFERFTDRARLVVVLAQEESRRLQHNFIGTEHILLGLVQEGEGVAAKALGSLGVDLAVVRVQVEETIGRGESIPAGHIPFTPRAKRVLELSLREALQLGHNYLGTEHILLGLIREGEGVAAEVLGKLGVGLDQARARVIQLLSGVEPTAGATIRAPEVQRAGLFGSFGTTSLTASALAEVLKEAESRGHSRLGTEHILLWLIGLPTGGASRALEESGVDLKAVRERLETQLSESGGSTDP